MELRCVDPESGDVCHPDTPGEIQMRGYSLMLGYFNDQAATDAALTADGWFRTGDMGVLRSDGHLRFLGRYKDMLKIGGENVAPAEVEAFLMTHPAVREVAVVGRPDARLGEIAVAFVRLRENCQVRGDQLIDFCRGRIASFKIPREVRFVNELPMTPTGKVRKNMLREQLARQSDPVR
jgi:acyl-CoA synthetase (AMP-forming)/AMP-acid ligase II